MKKRFVKMILVTTLLNLSLMLGGCDGKDDLLPTTTEAPISGSVVDPLATPAPTAEPTEEPKVTEAPKATEAPAEITKAPEAEVTEEPKVTEAPVEATEAPTVEPTEAPKVTEKPKATEAPTAKPTEAPKPTQAPTAKPTEAPKPTQAPATPAPTKAPVAHTHTWDGGTITVQPDCGNAGMKEYKCSCGETKHEAVGATGSHSWYESYFQYPTCTKGGSSTKICSICGAHGEVTTYDYLPHDYESTLSWEGNCSHPSSYKNVCKNCGWEGEKTYGDLNPNVHDWQTYTSEVWDETTYKWVEITGTYCGMCNATK